MVIAALLIEGRRALCVCRSEGKEKRSTSRVLSSGRCIPKRECKAVMKAGARRTSVLGKLKKKLGIDCHQFFGERGGKLRAKKSLLH